jgi:tetratricopeptide (TPR) repeat protein
MRTKSILSIASTLALLTTPVPVCAQDQNEREATVLNNFGIELKRLGKLDEAQTNFEKAMHLYTNPKDVASVLLNLADVYHRQGKLQSEEAALSQAVSKFGDDKVPEAAIALSQLGETELNLDRYDAAEACLKQALVIEAINKTETALDRSMLARVYLAQGRYHDAETLYKAALDDVVSARGAEHADVATALSNFALCCMSEQKLRDAEHLLKQAIAIRQKSLGADHPAVARAYSNLADVYASELRWADAEDLVKQALAIEGKALPSTHPDIATNLRSLALIQEAQLKWNDAEITYRRLLQYDADASVPEAALAADLDAAVRTLRAQKKDADARPLAAQSARIKATIPGLVASAQPIVVDPTGKPNAPPYSATCPVRSKWALVVGISNFADPDLNLKYAAKDATDFSDYLVKEAHFEPDHVKLLLDRHATRQDIVDNLGDKWLKHNAQPDDLVVIYVSSHGSSAKQETGNANFIIPYDGNLENVVFNGIPMQWLTAGIKDLIHCNRIVLVLDVCHGGAIAEGAKGVYRSEMELDPKKLLTGEGQLVVASSQADQVSWESKQYPNGVFTRRLLEGLRRNGDKTTLKDAYGYMREKVTEEVLRDRAHFQTPVLITKWWQGDDISIAVQPVVARSTKL